MLLSILCDDLLYGFVSPLDPSEQVGRYPTFSNSWYKGDHSIFTRNFASPELDSYYFSLNLRVMLVTTASEYLVEGLKRINRLSSDIEYIIPLSLPDQAYLSFYFDYLALENLSAMDVILLPNSLAQENDPEDIRFRFDRFYYPGLQNRFYYFAIREVQYTLEYYRKLFVTSMEAPQEYYDTLIYDVTILPVQILTTDYDYLHALSLNALYICHISPNGHKYTSSHLCQFAVPTGMGNFQVNGEGTISDSIIIAMQLMNYVSAIESGLYNRISIIKQSTKYRCQFSSSINYSVVKYERGMGFGILSAKALKEQIDNIGLAPNTATYYNLTILSKNNLGQGDTFDIGDVEVYRIFVTLRGNLDEYQPLYEYMAYTSFLTNDDIAPYEDISIYLCYQYGRSLRPFLLGTIRGGSLGDEPGRIPFILQQNNLWNTRLYGQISILFTYEKNYSRLLQDINQKGYQALQTDLKIALNVACKLNSVPVRLLTNVEELYLGQTIMFQTSAYHVYSYCYNYKMVYADFYFSSTNLSEIKEIMIYSIGHCVLYFCNDKMQNTEALLLSDICSFSYFFVVRNRSLISAFFVLVSVVSACAIMMTMIFHIKLRISMKVPGFVI